ECLLGVFQIERVEVAHLLAVDGDHAQDVALPDNEALAALARHDQPPHQPARALRRPAVPEPRAVPRSTPTRHSQCSSLSGRTPPMVAGDAVKPPPDAARRGIADVPSVARVYNHAAVIHVWMAPAWQEIIWRAAQRSLAVMCPACWCSPGGLLALMGSANRVLIIRTGSMSR